MAEERHLPWLVLLLGLLLTAVVCDQVRRLGQQAHERIERALLDEVATAIENKLLQDVDTISGVAGLFDASQQVTRAEFLRFHQALRRDDNRLDGIQGIGFTKLITPATLAAVETQVRNEGFPQFQVRPAGRRPLYSSILYLEPFNLRNQRAFGFDMYSEATRREAMERAALTGMPAMSGKVKLLQETNSKVQPGVLIYIPVYVQGHRTLPGTPAEFAGTLLGWAYSPIRVTDLLQASLREVNHPDREASAVLVYEGSQARDQALLYDDKNLHGSPALFHPQFRTISVAGRDWLVGIQLSSPQVSHSGISPNLLLIGLFGTMASGMTAMGTRFLVSNQQRTLQALRSAQEAGRQRALVEAVFEASPQGIVVTDPQGRVISANQSFARITGYAGAEILGRTLALLKSGRHEPAFYEELWGTLIQRGFWQGEIWNRLRSGEIRRHELSITMVRNQDLAVVHYVGMLQDVSDRHRDQEVILHRSLHDPLTGLANRSMLVEFADQSLALAERHHGSVGLLFLDLDGFKPLNDRLGHAFGDRVLVSVAHRIQQAVRKSDLVARIGGDEFVLLVPQALGLENLQVLAAEVRRQMLGVGEDLGEEIALSVSVGIAISPDHGVTVGQLMASADAAMYRAKANPHEPVQVAEISPAGSPG